MYDDGFAEGFAWLYFFTDGFGTGVFFGSNSSRQDDDYSSRSRKPTSDPYDPWDDPLFSDDWQDRL